MTEENLFGEDEDEYDPYEDKFIEINDELLSLRTDLYTLSDNDLKYLHNLASDEEEEFSDRNMDYIVNMWFNGESEFPDFSSNTIYVAETKPVVKKDPFLTLVQVYMGDRHAYDVTDDRIISYEGDLVSDQERHRGVQRALELIISEALSNAKSHGASGLTLKFHSTPQRDEKED